MINLKVVLAICGTAATIAYWALTRQDGTALTVLMGFLGGLAVGSIPTEKATE